MTSARGSALRRASQSSALKVIMAVSLIAGVVTTVYWTPLAAGGWPPPAANAFYEDLQASDPIDAATSHRPQLEESPTEPQVLPTEPEAAPTKPEASPTESDGSPTATDASPTGAPDIRAVARDREPISLSIPDLGVESPVVTTSMDASRSIVVPEDVMETGWYDGSRRLGASYGSTVIVGHRDSATQGSGALFGIEEIPLGSTITVTAQNGRIHEFIVDSVELIDKSLLPAEAPRIFTRTGDYRLVLITCGGAFDEGARSYLSNVVITALPAPAISE
jgi:sortase (surface protein transpeptidase)